MTYKEVISVLESMKNLRGIKHYRRMFGTKNESLGLGLTQLRKVATKIKINTVLAEELWSSKYFEAKLLSLMADDPANYFQKELDSKLKEFPLEFTSTPLSYAMIVFGEFIVSKSPAAESVVINWSEKKGPEYRFAAYTALANMAKNPKVKDEYFLQFIPKIKKNIQIEENSVKDAMNTCMLYIGSRSAKLNGLILNAAKSAGKIVVDYGDTSCQTPNIVEILNSDRIQKKLS